ncbi:UbiA family prenyltransferase [Methanobacterium sp. MBAC-LM]|uniref:UbiA family prenyltransferase n=1 Tax=Methanobacterium sp. MBAC-LM TaxID=3412034 RepID=UPI003C76732A
MNAYLEIIRPGNAVMAVVAVILVVFISGNFTLSAFLACIVVFVVIGGGNAINDYFDHKIDAINKPNRPIPSGRISLKAAGTYSLSLFVVGTIIAFIIGLLPGIIALSTSILLALYAYTLKKMALIGNIVVSFFTGLTFVFGGVVVGAMGTSIYLGFFAFLMTMAREIVKDMEDVEGDRKEGATTLPIIYGMKSASILAAVFMIIASVASPVLYFIGIFNILYLAPLFAAIVVFLISAASILKDQSIQNTAKVSKRIKIGMGITFLAFAVGSPFLASLI